MNILVSGATGLVGFESVWQLSTEKNTVKTLVRHKPVHFTEIQWNPPQSGPDPLALEGIDAVVHLAGENIASGKWTEAKKKEILESRVTGTRLLSEALAAMSTPPKVLISASAIGFYGDRGGDIMREGSGAGKGFLADVCKVWEAATAPASERGVRVVHLRLGVVLSARGGALVQMLPPFKLGIGGALGSGQQYMSWISLDDVVGAISFILLKETLRGPINLVAPNAVTNLEFTKTLGRVLERPTFLKMPSFLVRLTLGEMADSLLLASTRVEPSVLARSGYQFKYPDLEGALRHLFKLMEEKQGEKKTQAAQS